MAEQETGKRMHVQIMSDTEWEQTSEEYLWKRELLCSFRHVSYCKIQVYGDCFTGVLKIPGKKRPEGKAETLGFYAGEGTLVFLDNSSRTRHCLEKICRAEAGAQTGALLLLLAVWNWIIAEDVPWLQKFEDRITELEDLLLESTPREFPEILMRLRREIMKFHNFYVQFLDAAENLQGAFSGSMTEAEKTGWSVFTNRLSRLHDYTENIRENLLELHELYQAQVDIRQNEIMTVLTVVTTVFLPLSLLAGWYGMNFENIFLLNWKYGYPAVIALTAAIILLELGYFRKKGFLGKRKGTEILRSRKDRGDRKRTD